MKWMRLNRSSGTTEEDETSLNIESPQTGIMPKISVSTPIVGK